MRIINNGVKDIASIRVVIDQSIKEIKSIYSVIEGKAVLIWTAVKDFVAGVFSQGYWQNSEGWNNDDLWKNKP